MRRLRHGPTVPRGRWLFYALLLMVIVPVALLRWKPFLFMPSAVVPGYPGLEMHGPSYRVEPAIRAVTVGGERSKTLRNLLEGLREHPTHVIPFVESIGGGDFARYNTASNTALVLGLPGYEQTGGHVRWFGSLLAHEVGHRLLRAASVPLTLDEEVFCRWLQRRVEAEIDGVSPSETLSEQEIADVEFEYRLDGLRDTHRRFLVAVRALEARGYFPTGSAAAASAQRSVRNRLRSQGADAL